MALLPRRLGASFGTSARPSAIPDRTAVNIDWLVRLRWAEVVGQSATVLVAQVVFGVALPIVPLLIVVGVGLLSNLALEVRLGRGGLGLDDPAEGAALPPAPPSSVPEWQLAAVMALDIVLLTALLFLSGGPLNPFGSLYLVQIALATVIMVSAAWIWMLVALSFLGFGVLLIAHEPLPMPDGTRMIGLWVALGVSSAFVVHFLLRITRALAAREEELAAARHLASRQERLASLATMAAGAAHELSTPLGTVALAAKELERALGRRGEGKPSASDEQLVEDARLIREQVGRCRLILDQMAQGAGTIGESLAKMPVQELIEEAISGTRAAPPVRRELSAAIAGLALEVPRLAVASALRSLITNAQDASSADQPVVVRVRADLSAPPHGAHVVIVIVDRGSGMDAELLARIGEPFFTTKAPGRGMGLGMFLARAVVEGVGGTLSLESAPGHGTTAQVTLPLSPLGGETRGVTPASKPRSEPAAEEPAATAGASAAPDSAAAPVSVPASPSAPPSVLDVPHSPGREPP
jgi:two-component system sensor histidine kinase RegB